MRPRIGNGFDVHQFAEGRRLIVGGVEIPHDKGLLGHSDADVALHALTDAILGAANLGDIGVLFPDTDPEFKDIDSKLLLAEAMARVRDAGYEFGNADITIIAQEPKMRPFIPRMQKAISEVIGCQEEDISVKATTTERLGFTGRKEGIAAMAAAILFKR